MAPRSESGFTYIEMIVTAMILAILASAVMPLARVTYRRQRELELRRVLREIRTAIDRYHDAADPTRSGGVARIGGTDVKLGSEGYPPDLDTLVKGVNQVGRVDGVKLKFLRRIPMDPMTRSNEWGMRCYQDEPDSTSWCGQNVWDVYSKSEGKGLDGTPYKEW